MKDEKQTKVIEAAKEIFLRYGYKRVTMAEIADAVEMSRPALYLVYPSKEEIFTAVVETICGEMLDEIRQNLPTISKEKEKLMFAFEVWCVRPFEIMQSSPDARDLLENSNKIAGQVAGRAYAEFESIVAGILEPLITAQSKLTSKQLARIIVSAIYGFKNAAGNVTEFRQLFDDLITVILASIQSPTAPSRTDV